MTHTERFEIVGALYYAATGYLRPGKSNPPEMGRDSNDDENRERFENYCATRLLSDALAEIVRLQKETDELQTIIEGREL